VVNNLLVSKINAEQELKLQKQKIYGLKQSINQLKSIKNNLKISNKNYINENKDLRKKNKNKKNLEKFFFGDFVGFSKIIKRISNKLTLMNNFSDRNAAIAMKTTIPNLVKNPTYVIQTPSESTIRRWRIKKMKKNPVYHFGNVLYFDQGSRFGLKLINIDSSYYLNNKNEMRFLGTKTVNGSTAEHYEFGIKNILSKYGVDEKHFWLCVCDSSSANLLCVKRLRWQFLPCLKHLISNCHKNGILQAFPKLSTLFKFICEQLHRADGVIRKAVIINKYRKGEIRFQNYTIENENQIVNNENIVPDGYKGNIPKKMPKFVDTRWFCIYLMAKEFLNLRTEVINAYEHGLIDSNPSHRDSNNIPVELSNVISYNYNTTWELLINSI